MLEELSSKKTSTVWLNSAGKVFRRSKVKMFNTVLHRSGSMLPTFGSRPKQGGSSRWIKVQEKEKETARVWERSRERVESVRTGIG